MGFIFYIFIVLLLFFILYKSYNNTKGARLLRFSQFVRFCFRISSFCFLYDIIHLGICPYYTLYIYIILFYRMTGGGNLLHVCNFVCVRRQRNPQAISGYYKSYTGEHGRNRMDFYHETRSLVMLYHGICHRHISRMVFYGFFVVRAV